MEINLFDEILAVVTTADVVEGRFVLLTTNSYSYDLGSYADLPGVKVPATAEEAKRARFCVTWAVDNRKPPFYEPTPSFSFAQRGGWDQAANVPFNAKVRLTYPGYQNSETIPSGTPCLAFGKGVYTIPSGQYIYSSNIIVKGAPVCVANTAEDTTDAGKPKYQATMDERIVAFTERYDSSTGDLTIRVRD